MIERLADLKSHLDHLERIMADRTVDVAALESERSLHNDVLFSLFMACQAVIDVAGEIASRHGLRFQDYTQAVRALHDVPGFPAELVRSLEPLPGVRNILIHEYTDLDYELVVEALGRLSSLRDFISLATHELETGTS